MFESNIEQKMRPHKKAIKIKKNTLISKSNGKGYKVMTTKCRLLTIKMVRKIKKISRVNFFNKLKNFFIKFSISDKFL
jgi:hypothetical protein